MLDNYWIEIPVFIHGVDIEERPESHKPPFMELLEMVNSKLKDLNKTSFDEEPVMLEWGSELSSGRDSNLSSAERRLRGEVSNSFKESDAYKGNLLNYFHNITRKIFIFGLTDAIFYFSVDGGRMIRENIYNEITNCISPILGESNKKGISFTLFAHSIGSVISNDILSELYKKTDDINDENLQLLRKNIIENKLRIRRLYTFGSPLALSIFREPELMMKLVNKEKIDISSLGFLKQDDISLPRWVNFCELSDVFSYPVGFLYSSFDDDDVVVDYFLSSGDLTAITAHGKYFELEEVAEYIAKTF
jgi:hypothetical protein